MAVIGLSVCTFETLQFASDFYHFVKKLCKCNIYFIVAVTQDECKLLGFVQISKMGENFHQCIVQCESWCAILRAVKQEVFLIFNSIWTVRTGSFIKWYLCWSAVTAFLNAQIVGTNTETGDCISLESVCYISQISFFNKVIFEPYICSQFFFSRGL